MKYHIKPCDYGDLSVDEAEDESSTPELLEELENLTREVSMLRSEVVTLRKRNHELRQFVVTQLPNLVQKQSVSKISRSVMAPDPEEPKPVERRRVARRRTRFENGMILSKTYSIITDCLIFDMSEDGFRVKVADTIVIPDEFYLLRHSDGQLILGNVRWHRGGHIGCITLKNVSRKDKTYPKDLIKSALMSIRL
jgi:hypothetical protein